MPSKLEIKDHYHSFQARAISHEDALGHLVVNLLELMQSVLVGGLRSSVHYC